MNFEYVCAFYVRRRVFGTAMLVPILFCCEQVAAGSALPLGDAPSSELKLPPRFDYRQKHRLALRSSSRFFKQSTGIDDLLGFKNLQVIKIEQRNCSAFTPILQSLLYLAYARY